MNTSSSKHVVWCDNEPVRECDTVQESVAFGNRLELEGQEVGLRLECKITEEKETAK
jgi:hypothetical protein